MKYFAFLTATFFVFYVAGIKNRTESFKWMDRNFTTAVKGFAIFTVVWAHSGARLGVGRIQFIAGIGVALFLMCSGYGLEISYEKNGLKGFWKKRLLGVCLPFWMVDLIGLLITGTFSVKTYLLDFSFLKPATSYGWFMGYIVICYLIFYTVKRFLTDSKLQTMILFGAFAVWFVLDSVFFANPDMPFLRARQMLSFPCGVLLAMNKDKFEQALTKTKSLLILAGGGITCLVFMAVTQLRIVKELPYLAQNTMALLTCLPISVGILVFGKAFGRIFENRSLLFMGTISYEIYLIHAFALNMLSKNPPEVIFFVLLTVSLAAILHITNILMKRKCNEFAKK